MHGSRLLALQLLAAALMVGLAACSEGSTQPRPDPTTGSIRVTVRTTGLGLDEDGYALRLDQSATRSVLSNSTTTITGLEPGDHALTVEGATDNCAPVPASTVVSVTAGDTAALDVDVQCVIDLRGRLVISSESYGLPQLLALRPDGTNRYRLLADQFGNGSPAVFADGSRIAFVSHRTGVARLHLLTASTGVVSPLPEIGDMEFGPAVSPDGGRIAFEVMVTDAEDRTSFRIWVMDADGSNAAAVTTGGPEDPPDNGPSWTPDGEWITFSRNGTLAQVRPDGSSLTVLDCEPSPCNHPVWSPVGNKLAYTGITDGSGDGVGENYDIYVRDFGTGITTRLTSSPDQEDNPTWSPDGTMLAYLRLMSGKIQVFRMQADGSDQVNLTNMPISEGTVSWGPAP